MRERLTHNLGLKILSLFLAALAWFLIMNIADPIVTENFTNIPVHIMNDDVLTSRGYGYTVESGDKVSLRVRGKKSIVEDLTDQDFFATADFRSLNDMYMVPITVVCTAEKSEELIITQRTETMAVKREEQTTLAFEADVRPLGTIKEGCMLVGCEADTLEVEVTGSRTQIADVARLLVIPDVSDRSESFTAKFPVVAYDIYGNKIDSRKLVFNPAEIECSVSIYPIKEIVVEVVPVGEVAAGYYLDHISCTPSTLALAAEGDAVTLMKKLMVSCNLHGASSDVTMTVDVNKYLHSLGYDNVVTDEDNSSILINAVIRKSMTKSLPITASDIKSVGVGAGLTSTLHGLWGATVKLSGSEELITKFTLEDLGLYVDMTGCGEGTYTRRLCSTYDGNVEIELGTVTVKLTAGD